MPAIYVPRPRNVALKSRDQFRCKRPNQNQNTHAYDHSDVLLDRCDCPEHLKDRQLGEAKVEDEEEICAIAALPLLDLPVEFE